SFSIGTNPGSGLTVQKSGKYWLEMTDRENLIGGTDDRWELRALVDPPPAVTLERPASNVFVTPEAIVPVRATVKDNLAIRRIVLSYSLGNPSDKAGQSLELYGGPEKVQPQSAADVTSASGETQIVDKRWDLAPFKWSPGTQVLIHIDAEDYQPKTGSSTICK